MPVDIKKQGDYELFCTTKDHRILKLGSSWFAIVEGNKGEILVGSDADHEKDHTISKGKYRLVDFEDDPKFKDMPHLFLQSNGHYDEWMLPNGLPSSKGDKQKVVRTDETLGRKELEDYLADPAPAGEGARD